MLTKARHGTNRSTPTSRPTLNELRAMGKSLRQQCPRSSHAIWKAPANRPNPLRLLEQSNKGRIPGLIPIRYGRMVRTPFTFYRGAALNMAADLAGTPVTGMRVQACGDCHLLNFGAYATPERRLVFDINDLDETLPAPWEWDVKRLAASFVLACRNNGFSQGDARDAALACVRAYRERMAEYSDMPVLEVWYASIDVEKVIATVKDKEASRRSQKRFSAARARSVLEHDFPKLATGAGHAPTIKDTPPLIYHLSGESAKELDVRARAAFTSYRDSLPAALWVVRRSQPDREMVRGRFRPRSASWRRARRSSCWGARCSPTTPRACSRTPSICRSPARSCVPACASRSSPSCSGSIRYRIAELALKVFPHGVPSVPGESGHHRRPDSAIDHRRGGAPGRVDGAARRSRAGRSTDRRRDIHTPASEFDRTSRRPARSERVSRAARRYRGVVGPRALCATGEASRRSPTWST